MADCDRLNQKKLRDRQRGGTLTAVTRLSIQYAQLILGFLQHLALLHRQMLTRPVDVKIEHRHCGYKRLRLAPLTAVGGVLQRQCNSMRIIPGKHAGFEIEGVAGFGDMVGPVLGIIFVH